VSKPFNASSQRAWEIAPFSDATTHAREKNERPNVEAEASVREGNMPL